MKKRITFMLLLVSVIYVKSVSGQAPAKDGGGSDCPPVSALDFDEEGVPTISAERLLKESICFDRRFIRVYGFVGPGFGRHNWVLFCLDCVNHEPVDLNFKFYRAAYKRCSSKSELKKIDSDELEAAGLVALGVVNRGGFRSSYTFSVICVDEIKVFAGHPSEKTTRRMKDWYDKVRVRY